MRSRSPEGEHERPARTGPSSTRPHAAPAGDHVPADDQWRRNAEIDAALRQPAGNLALTGRNHARPRRTMLVGTASPRASAPRCPKVAKNGSETSPVRAYTMNGLTSTTATSPAPRVKHRDRPHLESARGNERGCDHEARAGDDHQRQRQLRRGQVLEREQQHRQHRGAPAAERPLAVAQGQAPAAGSGTRARGRGDPSCGRACRARTRTCNRGQRWRRPAGDVRARRSGEERRQGGGQREHVVGDQRAEGQGDRRRQHRTAGTASPRRG